MRPYTLTAGIGFASAFAWLVAACAPMEPRAPVVDAAMVDQAGGASLATLSQGRRIFLTLCPKYHRCDKATSHSTIEWHGIVDRMSERAGWTREEQSALLAYLAAANAAARSR